VKRVGIVSRYRYAVGFLAAFVVWSVVGGALPISLGWGLILVTLLSGIIAGVVTVKLLKARGVSDDDAAR
jgi:hypothetical protein